MSAELFSRLYAFLGDRTLHPTGYEWEHGRLQRLVRDLLDGPLGAEPITWPELVARTVDDEWTWDNCVCCGSTETRAYGVILEDGPAGALRRVAWCERVGCDVDRAQTDYLVLPRARSVQR